MKLKVCGLTQEHNIKDIVLLQPDYIGLIFYDKSKRYVKRDAALCKYISTVSDVKKVGVFVNSSYDEIVETIEQYQLDLIQLHGNESAMFCQRLNQLVPVIKSFGVSTLFDFDVLSLYNNSCRYFLFDTYSTEYGGSGKQFDWRVLDSINIEKDFFLSGGIGPDDIETIKRLANSSLIGIDINSRVEVSPGIKNVEQVKKISDEIFDR